MYHVNGPLAIGATNPSYLVAEVTLTLLFVWLITATYMFAASPHRSMLPTLVLQIMHEHWPERQCGPAAQLHACMLSV